MNFISITVHQIFDPFTPKNCNFFSLFLCIFPDFKANFLIFNFPNFKLLPLMNFISITVHRIFDSFTPKNCNFFLYFHASCNTLVTTKPTHLSTSNGEVRFYGFKYMHTRLLALLVITLIGVQIKQNW